MVGERKIATTEMKGHGEQRIDVWALQYGLQHLRPSILEDKGIYFYTDMDGFYEMDVDQKTASINV